MNKIILQEFFIKISVIVISIMLFLMFSDNYFYLKIDEYYITCNLIIFFLNFFLIERLDKIKKTFNEKNIVKYTSINKFDKQTEIIYVLFLYVITMLSIALKFYNGLNVKLLLFTFMGINFISLFTQNIRAIIFYKKSL